MGRQTRPFELRGPNGEIYGCKVVTSTRDDSVIRLLNQKTGDKWACRVTSANIDSFRSKQKDLRLCGLQQVVIGILQEAFRGKLGPLTSSYDPSHDWCSLSLKQKHSTYFMKLKLVCQIGGSRGSWSFPMNPRTLPQFKSVCQLKTGRIETWGYVTKQHRANRDGAAKLARKLALGWRISLA